MKKPARKQLTLRAETLQVLKRGDLADVVGAQFDPLWQLAQVPAPPTP
jgi:hypothetical protein